MAVLADANEYYNILHMEYSTQPIIVCSVHMDIMIVDGSATRTAAAAEAQVRCGSFAVVKIKNLHQTPSLALCFLVNLKTLIFFCYHTV